MSDKRYVGSGWTGKFGIKLAVNLKKLHDLKDVEPDKYGNVYLEVNPRREPDEKSKATHYIVVDEYHYQKAKDEPF